MKFNLFNLFISMSIASCKDIVLMNSGFITLDNTLSSLKLLEIIS